MKTEDEIKLRLKEHTQTLDDLNLDYNKVINDKQISSKEYLAYLRCLMGKESAVINALGWVLGLNEYN